MSDPTLPQPPYEPTQSYPPLPLGYAAPTTSPRPTPVLVLSILGIVTGSYRVLCAPVSFFALFAASRGSFVVSRTAVSATTMATTTATTTTTTAVPLVAPLMWWSVALAVVSLVLGIAVLIGAIGSLMLKPWARRLMLCYAAISLVMSLGRLAMNLYDLPSTLQRTVRLGDFALFFIVGTLTLSLILGIAYPLCVLIFFRRADVVEAFETHRISRGGPMT